MKRILLLLTTIVLAALQNTDGLLPTFFGARLMPLIPFVVCVGIFEGETAGLLYGAAAGAFWLCAEAALGWLCCAAFGCAGADAFCCCAGAGAAFASGFFAGAVSAKIVSIFT